MRRIDLAFTIAAALAAAAGAAQAQTPGRSAMENLLAPDKAGLGNPIDTAMASKPTAVASVVNIEGVKGSRLKLTGQVLADIYLGNITRWDAPQIAKLNPGLALPHEQIVVVRRADVSGPTVSFTNYLAGQSQTFREEVGKAGAVKWPVGVAAEGDQGMADTVGKTRNAIGYMDLVSAEHSGLAVARLIDGKSLPQRAVSPKPDLSLRNLSKAGAPTNPAQ
jgi:ABC-type phosphate transport system substrate-binding protein